MENHQAINEGQKLKSERSTNQAAIISQIDSQRIVDALFEKVSLNENNSQSKDFFDLVTETID